MVHPESAITLNPTPLRNELNGTIRLKPIPNKGLVFYGDRGPGNTPDYLAKVAVKDYLLHGDPKDLDKAIYKEVINRYSPEGFVDCLVSAYSLDTDKHLEPTLLEKRVRRVVHQWSIPNGAGLSSDENLHARMELVKAFATWDYKKWTDDYAAQYSDRIAQKTAWERLFHHTFSLDELVRGIKYFPDNAFITGNFSHQDEYRAQTRAVHNIISALDRRALSNKNTNTPDALNPEDTTLDKILRNLDNYYKQFKTDRMQYLQTIRGKIGNILISTSTSDNLEDADLHMLFAGLSSEKAVVRDTARRELRRQYDAGKQLKKQIGENPLVRQIIGRIFRLPLKIDVPDWKFIADLSFIKDDDLAKSYINLITYNINAQAETSNLNSIYRGLAGLLQGKSPEEVRILLDRKGTLLVSGLIKSIKNFDNINLPVPYEEDYGETRTNALRLIAEIIRSDPGTVKRNNFDKLKNIMARRIRWGDSEKSRMFQQAHSEAIKLLRKSIKLQNLQ